MDAHREGHANMFPVNVGGGMAWHGIVPSSSSGDKCAFMWPSTSCNIDASAARNLWLP